MPRKFGVRLNVGVCLLGVRTHERGEPQDGRAEDQFRTKVSYREGGVFPTGGAPRACAGPFITPEPHTLV